MNSLIFLSGLGTGALVIVLLVIAFLGYAARKAVNSKEQVERYNKQHDELIAMYVERNRLIALQVNSLCHHRNVTISGEPGEGHCDRCGFEVSHNKTTGNWE